MQVPALVVRLVAWRWMPSVALVLGSLAFAGVAILIVPDDLGNFASGTEKLSRAARSTMAAPVPTTTAEEGPSSGDEEPVMPPATHPLRHLMPRAASHDVVQSIFHPAARTELPVEPVDPEPQAPPPPPPPPAPTATIYSLENPPPPAPNPLAGPEPAQDPQAIPPQ